MLDKLADKFLLAINFSSGNRQSIAGNYNNNLFAIIFY